LYDDVSRMTKSAVRLNRSTVRVDVPNLHDRSKGDKYNAEDAKGHPERMTCSLIEAAT
jgi:hypothetical protein